MILALALAVASSFPPTSPATLWDLWPAERFVPAPAPCLRHADVSAAAQALAAAYPRLVSLEEIGRSFEGRPIQLLKIGRGERRVMLWSQMHGDEPSATPALLDLAAYLAARADEAGPARILDELTLLLVPMLNPDGAERYQRRNAQEIDVNRDALALSTPEGALLKALRARYQPVLGFNLHDQNRRTAVGDTGRLASIALLAVAGDAEGTVTPGRLRAKRIASALVAALSPQIPGGIARYDEDWSPRAFGDNLTAWGTPVVLIESGGLPPGQPMADLTRLNFVALVTALEALARDDAAGHDPALYEALPRNESSAWADVVLQGGQVLQPNAPPYRADLAFDRRISDQSRVGCGPEPEGSRIAEIGDARFLGAGERVDVSGALLAPALTASVGGLDARAWLTADALEAIGRLGVATLRWQVPPADQAAATAHASALARAGLPSILVNAADEPPAILMLAAAPAAARAPTLAAALDALAPDWRQRLAGRSLFSGLGRLAYEGRAHVIQLRAASVGALEPDRLVLERVWIDGRPAR